MNASPLQLTIDPAWPWSLPRLGLPALALVALVLAGLTLWTYHGVANPGRRRVAVVLALRLLALLLALLTLVRPSLAVREDARIPSVLLVACDASESMAVADEVDGKTRWATLQKLMAKCAPLFEELQQQQNVRVVPYRFAEDVGDYDADGKADGKRTDFGQMLHALNERHAAERSLRGLLILSDGADNGTRHPALGEAAHWRALACPVTTFGLGQETTSKSQRDVAITAIAADPSPVPVKGKLTVRATVDAPGFENQSVVFHLSIDDKEVTTHEARLNKSFGNDVQITVDAPASPGEVKLTLKADPLTGEASTINNVIGTYLTVTKEGLSVLYVDRLRPERIDVVRALKSDPRIRLFEAVRQTEQPFGPDEADAFNFDKQAYDVIILGDLSARVLTGGDGRVLKKIDELVRDKGVGLMVLGGQFSFGNGDWQGTPLADLLPVQLNVPGQSPPDVPVTMVPTREGSTDYLMRLLPDPAKNDELWKRLPKLSGYTKLGRRKDGAVVLAQSLENSEPLLVRQTVGKGRVIAFAADTTARWKGLGLPKTREGFDLFNRFWKQTALWLAHQEETEGSVWVKPDLRRLPAGGKVSFGLGLRGKTGLDLPAAQFEVQVFAPGQSAPETVPTARERDGERGTFWKTEKPGEYRIRVSGHGKDADGTEIKGEASARFLVYQDDTEMLRQAADHDFLTRLAQQGGGKFYRADELPRFLQELKSKPQPEGKQKVQLWPDWKQSRTGGFLPSLLIAFVAVLAAEWGLRRYWGMV
jgi:uncharacterized membrane protein